MNTAQIESPPAVPKKPQPLEHLLVWAVPKKNTRIVVAYLPGEDPRNPNNLVTVNVEVNQNFQPNMVLHANMVNERVYDLVGEVPRWRGIW